MNNKDVRITSIEQLREAYGTDVDSIALTLSLAISRHLLLRELLDKSDKDGYIRANRMLATAIESFPRTFVKMNNRGWATQLKINGEDKTYTLALSKRIWKMVTNYVLEQFVDKQDASLSIAEQSEQEKFVDPDNDEYDDEVIVDENPQMRERFVGVCRTIGELKDALFGAGRDWEVLILANNDESCGKNYVSCEAQWNINSVCYFNDGSAPGENRELTTIADILEALDRFENDAEVYYYTVTGAFNRLTRPWWGRDALGGVDDDGSTRVFFKLAEGE